MGPPRALSALWRGLRVLLHLLTAFLLVALFMAPARARGGRFAQIGRAHV